MLAGGSAGFRSCMKGSQEGTAMRAVEDILKVEGKEGLQANYCSEKILTEALSLRSYCRHSCDP